MAEFEYYMLIKLAEALNSEGEYSIALVGKAAEPQQLNQFGKTVAHDEALNARDGEPNVMAFTDASLAVIWLLRDAPPVCSSHHRRMGASARRQGGRVRSILDDSFHYTSSV